MTGRGVGQVVRVGVLLVAGVDEHGVGIWKGPPGQGGGGPTVGDDGVVVVVGGVEEGDDLLLEEGLGQIGQLQVGEDHRDGQRPALLALVPRQLQ